jgi:DNA recombination protein RmuC
MENYWWILIASVAVLLIIVITFLVYHLRSHKPVVSNLKQFHSLIENLALKTEECAKTSDELIRHIVQDVYEKLLNYLNNTNIYQQKSLHEFKDTVQQSLNLHRSQFDKRQLSSLKLLQDSLMKGSQEVRQEVTLSLKKSSDDLSQRVEKLTLETDQRLKEISGQVEKRLSEGFEKTTATFTDIIKRLALIDEAQKKITELSANVVNLQEILADKRSRGAFGEMQLSALIHNMLPENSFAFQHTLSNGKRADCILFLPKPTGHIVIDAKFPLESYRRMTDISISQIERQQAEQQFRQDIRKHIQDIADKYILPGETSDGAVMFIPAEAIFSEIHAHCPDLVEISQRMHVWMVSPTTMMAILTTARAVIKDEVTRQQVHIIQDHLLHLAKDFERFRIRMDNLAKHIHQANEDVEQVHISAKKISGRFNQIEKVELDGHQEDTKVMTEA